MFSRFLVFREQVFYGLWFLPLLMTIGAVILAKFMLEFPVDIEDTSPWWIYNGNVREALNLLSTLLSSLITMATLAMSITMVVLTLAAAQLSPRLIRNYMGDWQNQATLGVFLGTTVYLIIVLQNLHRNIPESKTPYIAVTTGTLLLIICVVLLVVYIHHLGRSIIADTVIQRVGRDLEKAIIRFLPQKELPVYKTNFSLNDSQGTLLSLKKSGYVQAIDFEKLVKCAEEADITIKLMCRPGHYLLAGSNYILVFSQKDLSKSVKRAIRKCILIGKDRTALQDIEFSIRQLVEIALRALSPSNNDPYTAMTVIDRLSSALGQIMERGKAQIVWRDASGKERLMVPLPSFEGMMDAAFNQIRQIGENHISIQIHLLDVFRKLAELAKTDEHRQTILAHTRMVGEVGQRILKEARDIAAFEERHHTALLSLRQ